MDWIEPDYQWKVYDALESGSISIETLKNYLKLCTSLEISIWVNNLCDPTDDNRMFNFHPIDVKITKRAFREINMPFFESLYERPENV